MANIYCWAGGYTAVTQWAASTAVTVGTIRRQLATPTAGNERCFRCSTAGTTGATEPTWVITANGSTTDGTVTWIECTGQAAYNESGSYWGAPHYRVPVAVSFSAAGDTVFVASAHTESGTYSVSMSLTGTQTARTKILSVDETVVPSSNFTTLKAGASVSNSNGLSAISGSSGTTGCSAFYGLTYAQAQAAAVNLILGNGNTDLYFESCKFQLTGNTSNAAIQLGQANPATSNRLKLKNCSFKFANTGQFVALRSAQTVIQGLSLEAGSSIPTTMFRVLASNFGGVDCLIMDSDLSALAGNNLFDLTPIANNFVNFRLQNCKLSSNLVIPSTVYRPGYRFRMDNCDSAGTNYRFLQVDFAGTVKQNQSVSVTGISAELTTVNNVAWETPLEFALAPVRVSAGVPVTLNYNLACASTLTNSDIWIEVEYPGSASSPQGSIATTGMTTITGTPSGLASLFANWTNNPGNIYTKTVSFTPALSGWALPVVKMAKKNATIYVDLGGGSLVPGHDFAGPSSGLLVHPGMAGGMRG